MTGDIPAAAPCPYGIMSGWCLSSLTGTGRGLGRLVNVVRGTVSGSVVERTSKSGMEWVPRPARSKVTRYVLLEVSQASTVPVKRPSWGLRSLPASGDIWESCYSDVDRIK